MEVLPPAPVPAPRAQARAVPLAGARSVSLFEGAVALMALPVILTAGMMLAPLALMWAGRKSSHG